MSSPAATYNLAAVVFVIGGIAISGYGEDGAIEVEFSAPLGSTTVGTAGAVAFSYSNNNVAIVRVTLLETQIANQRLMSIANAQREAADAGQQVPDTSFLLEDPLNGDRMSDSQCYVQALPTPSKGATAGSRVWEIMVPNGKRLGQLDFAPNARG